MEFDQNDTVWGLGSFEEDFQKHEGVFVENTHDKWEKKKKNAQPGKMTSTTLFKQNNNFTIAAINKDGIVYNTTKSLTTAYYNQKTHSKNTHVWIWVTFCRFKPIPKPL